MATGISVKIAVTLRAIVISSTRASSEAYPKSDRAGDDADFYAKVGDEYSNRLPGNSSGPRKLEYFIHVDSHTGYASFYTDRCYALQGCPQ